MTKFKQVREAARNLAVQATGDDGEEAKLNDLPSDASQLDDADENNRNPDGSAEDQVDKSIKPIYTKTDNGTYTLATEGVDEKKAARLAKIARAAAAREKDQAAQKEKGKEKHYAASKKSRAAIDYLKKGGNKDQFGRVREEDQAAQKEKAKSNPHRGSTLDEFLESIKPAVNEEIEQTDESLRQRADDAMTFSNRQAAYSTAFKKAHGRGPSKQELRDAGCGKGGDCPAGVKKYQAAMSKLRPASRSGIKDKFVHKEGLEQKLEKIRESKSTVEIEITENTIDDIKKLTTLSQAGTVRFADGSSAKVTPQSATALLQTHGNLNTNNQKKFAKKLASSASEFAKLEKFALQQAKLSGRLYQLNNL
jgi:hypothetical protein